MNKKIDVNIIRDHFQHFMAAAIIIMMVMWLVLFHGPSFEKYLVIILCLFICAYVFILYGLKQKIVPERTIVPLLAIYILLPPVSLPGGMPDLRFGFIFVLLLWLLYYLDSRTGSRRAVFAWNRSMIWFALFGLSAYISITYAALVLDYRPIVQDWFELFKIIQYFLIFALIAGLDIRREEYKRIYLWSLVIFTLTVLFGFAQYFNLFDINRLIMPYYTTTQLRGLRVHRRIIGTTANPNEFAALLVMGSSLALAGFLYLKEKLVRYASIICFALFTLGTALTLSRTGLAIQIIAGAYILFCHYPFYLARLKKIRGFIIVVVILILIVLLVFWLAPEKFFIRMASGLTIGGDESWQLRMGRWDEALSLWRQSPVFGWGPGKRTMSTIVDNEWLLLLRRYGVLGVTVFILWFGGMFAALVRLARSLNMRRDNEDRYLKVLTIAMQAVLVSYAIYMIPSVVYHSLQLMPILMIYLGLVFSSFKNRKKVLW